VPRPPLLPPRELEDSSELCDEEPLRPSLERPDEPLMPESESRDGELPLRDAELEPDEALRLLELPEEADKPSRLLPLELLPLALRVLSPLVDALSPPLPDRSCELPSPEFVLPEAPSPLLRSLLLPDVLEPLLPEAP
jgi:hypothetical protein